MFDTVNDVLEEGEWMWRVNWCQSKGISPYMTENWQKSKEEYLISKSTCRSSSYIEKTFGDIAISFAKRGDFNAAVKKLIGIYGYENSHSKYTVNMWIEKVNQRVTKESYWMWVAEQLVNE